MTKVTKIAKTASEQRFMEACEKLVRMDAGASGFMKAAGAALEISQPTLRVAIAKGPAEWLDAKASAMLARVSVVEGEELALDVGRWVIGEPETRKAGKGTVAECVVTHISPSAVLLMHAELACDHVTRQLVPLYRAQWCGPAPHAERSYRLLAEAQKRALARLEEIRNIRAHLRERELAVDDAKRSGSPLTREELESMPMLQLAIERQGATEKGLASALEHLTDVAQRADDEWLRGDSAMAYLSGVEAGEARYAARMARLALTSMQLGLRDEHMLAQLAAGKISVPGQRMRTAVTQPVAHANTVRGDAEARDVETENRLMRDDGRRVYADVMREDMMLPILLDYLEGKITRKDVLIKTGLLNPDELSIALRSAGLPEPKQAP